MRLVQGPSVVLITTVVKHLGLTAVIIVLTLYGDKLPRGVIISFVTHLISFFRFPGLPTGHMV